MATTAQQIDLWRSAPSEHQRLEFKEAKNQFDNRKLCEHCVALANEGGGGWVEGRLMPFEVKYRGSDHTEPRDVKGLLAFCAEQGVAQAYVITRDVTDFRVVDVEREGVKVRLVNVPAPLACFWLGRSELEAPSDEP